MGAVDGERVVDRGDHRQADRHDVGQRVPERLVVVHHVEVVGPRLQEPGDTGGEGAGLREPTAHHLQNSLRSVRERILVQARF